MDDHFARAPVSFLRYGSMWHRFCAAENFGRRQTTLVACAWVISLPEAHIMPGVDASEAQMHEASQTYRRTDRCSDSQPLVKDIVLVHKH